MNVRPSAGACPRICGTSDCADVLVFCEGELTNGYAEVSGICVIAISDSRCDACRRKLGLAITSVEIKCNAGELQMYYSDAKGEDGRMVGCRMGCKLRD